MNRTTCTTISLATLVCSLFALSLSTMPGCTRAAVENNDEPNAQQATTRPSESSNDDNADDAHAADDVDKPDTDAADDDDANSDAAMNDIDANAKVGPGIAFTPDASWTSQQPASSMRFAQFVLTSDAEPAELVVYYFGNTGAGSIDANINRWISQIAQPDGSDSREAATIDTRQINELKTTTIDLAGTYVAETRPGSGERVNKPDWHLLAAIVETEAGPYYFKVTGPSAAVEAARASFEQMLETIKPAPATNENSGASHPG